MPSGLGLVAALTDLTFAYLRDVAATVAWKPGWALLAVGGTGRGLLCPGSDIDLLLLHPPKAGDAGIAAIAEQLWYPLWDVGLKVTPGVHSPSSALELADAEVLSAVTWLDQRHVAGDPQVAADFGRSALEHWQSRAKRHLPALIELTSARHQRAGEVAFLLEPDLRDGRGGLRDVHILQFAERSGHPAVERALERPVADLAPHHDVLLATRAELHRRTGRPNDRLLLQEQDAVAAGLGYGNADHLMTAVSASARAIGWCVDESLRRISTALERRLPSRFGKPLRVAPLLSMQSGELVVADEADCAADPALLLRTASVAALNRAPISRHTLNRFAAEAPTLPSPWPDAARNALVALLGAGEDALPVIEALDHYGLMVRVLPEWAEVRSKPQRNAYHRFTVDRHLCQTAANGAALVRRVARPDLLLVGCWLHDLGKGLPGDHTEVGIALMEDIGTRMGFGPDDVDVLVDLVRHHLLLPDVATRRDLADPGTIAAVARAAKDVDRLQLLRALTESDSLATGPTAWSDWKARLCDELVMRTEAVLAGHRPPEPSAPDGPHHQRLLEEARAGAPLALHADGVGATTVYIAATDRPGLFCAIAGACSLHGVEILGADVWTTEDGYALDVLNVARRIGGETDWRKVTRTIAGALDGTVDLDAELAKRLTPYGRNGRLLAAHASAEPAVLVDDDAQERATVVEVRAPDGPAVLYRVTRALGQLGLDIRMAKVTTLGHEVVDAFSVLRVDDQGNRVKVGPLVTDVRQAVLAELSN